MSHVLRSGHRQTAPRADALPANRPAVFGSIDQVARLERKRMFGPEPEPVEVQLMRYQAGEEARRIMAEALEAAEEIRAEARKSGFEAGWAEGHTAGIAAATEAVHAETDRFRAEYHAEMEALFARIDETSRTLWLDAEPQLVSLALEIARKVVKQEAAINPDIVIEVVKNALRRVVDSEGLRIRVNAADLENVRAAREDILSIVDGARNAEIVEIVEDRRVGPGGCVVESASGTIDATVETQFRTIEESMYAPDLRARAEVSDSSMPAPAEANGDG